MRVYIYIYIYVCVIDFIKVMYRFVIDTISILHVFLVMHLVKYNSQEQQQSYSYLKLTKRHVCTVYSSINMSCISVNLFLY